MSPDDLLEPCQVVNMIGGTSTGWWVVLSSVLCIISLFLLLGLLECFLFSL
jgi:hypothetical protein